MARGREQVFKSRYKKFSGTSYDEVYPQAYKAYKEIKSRTKRRKANVRSVYFAGQKVFIYSFWSTLESVNSRDRVRRMKFFLCGIDLIRKNTLQPTTQVNKNNQNKLLHEFKGLTADNELFIVHIQENRRTNSKYFMSAYPK